MSATQNLRLSKKCFRIWATKIQRHWKYGCRRCPHRRLIEHGRGQLTNQRHGNPWPCSPLLLLGNSRSDPLTEMTSFNWLPSWALHSKIIYLSHWLIYPSSRITQFSNKFKFQNSLFIFLWYQVLSKILPLSLACRGMPVSEYSDQSLFSFVSLIPGLDKATLVLPRVLRGEDLDTLPLSSCHQENINACLNMCRYLRLMMQIYDAV